MTPEAILLSIRDLAGEGSYRFSCPECMNTIEKPADRKVVALLLSAGVELDDEEAAQMDRLTGARIAPRPKSLESRPDGPPFTVDDLIEFHFLLQDDTRLFASIPKD